MTFERADGARASWDSRRQRKGWAIRESRGEDHRGSARWLVWAPRSLSYWVALTYVVGSALFVAGAVASLSPGAPLVTDLGYFVGSLVFTAGVYGQLLESVNSVDRLGPRARRLKRMRWWAWQPHRLSFLVALLFLGGTLLYDAETAFVVAEELGWLELGVPLGVLSLAGSALFAAGGYLMLAEVCHGALCLEATSISWWSALLSALGCLGLLVGAIFGLQVAGLSSFQEPIIVALAYLAGSALFLIGSDLMIPETFSG